MQDTTDFVAAAEFLRRMADAKDAEGTSLGFMRLTMTCTNCHNHVRTASVAGLDGAPEKRLKKELHASTSGQDNAQAIDLPGLSTSQKKMELVITQFLTASNFLVDGDCSWEVTWP